jgi:hypothetical protein
MHVRRGRGRFSRLVAVLMVVGLLAAACGSDDDDDESGGGTTTTEATSTPVAISGVPGVTDDEIRFAAVGTNSNNPLGTCYLDCFLDGVDAYFAWRNSEGGLYGRKLVVSQKIDDEFSKNQQKAIEVIAANDTFAVFNAAIVSGGYAEYVKANWPVFTFLAEHSSGAHDNIFGSYAISCFDCPRLDYAYAAKATGATKIAALGYGVSESSKTCADQIESSFVKYNDVSGASVVYKNNDLPFGFPNGVGPEVSAMKRAGVELIFACLETNGMKTIAQELHRQGMADVPLVHYAGVDEDFFAQNAEIFEGNIIGTHLRPFVATPHTEGQKQFLKWMGQAGIDEIKEISIHGWIAADLAYQGLKAAGAPFDRQKVIDATNSLDEYTADGLLGLRNIGLQHEAAGATEPGPQGERPFCFSYLRFTKGAFELMEPATKAKPYVCWSGDSYDWVEPEAMTF